LRTRTDHQGEDHWETRSARNDAAMLAWEAGDLALLDEIGGPLETLEPLAPKAGAEARSAKDRRFRSGIILINETDRDLAVYWINETGSPQQRGTVPAHGSQARSSAPNQVWKVGETVFVTKQRPGTATVSVPTGSG
jgi:NADPH-dependent ferric siderophore reductase